MGFPNETVDIHPASCPVMPEQRVTILDVCWMLVEPAVEVRLTDHGIGG